MFSYWSNIYNIITSSFRLTTFQAMVIIWRLRENITRTVLYCQRAASSMGTVNKHSCKQKQCETRGLFMSLVIRY